MKTNRTDAAYKTGMLPVEAPLAMSYMPIQRSARPAYETVEALSRGTLFPGLDLPFMNIVNRTLSPSPLVELSAIDFVCDELGLYLDTHRDDVEAFEMYQTFLALKKEAHERYANKCGPICKTDMLGMSSYTWLENPWPWEFRADLEV